MRLDERIGRIDADLLSKGLLDTAVPSDVRRWLRLAVSGQFKFGLCPWSGLCPLTSFVKHLQGSSPNEGVAHNMKKKPGEAEPSPHIERRSRLAIDSILR